jgi:sodium/potassium-transporting ATPase subunit alpha
MTTLQREIFQFVVIIASLATLLAIIIVILWAAWWALSLSAVVIG